MKKFILMMGVAAFMAGCFEDSSTQAKSDSEESDESLIESSSSKKSSSSKQVKSSSSKKGKSSSSTNKIKLQSSSSIKVVFKVNSSSSVALPTIIAGSESSSSQQQLVIVDNPPMSSTAVVPGTDPVTNSSASTTVVTGLGSCNPSKTPIDKGTSTTWTFVPNPAKKANMNGAVAFAKAQYTWNFGDLSDDGNAMSTRSGSVTYVKSGKFGASVTVSMMNEETKLTETETIECSPLQVNGDPITGCQCTPIGVTGSVDYLKTPEVTWSVTGCTSASEITSYVWDGVEGSSSFTKAFTTSTESYAPTLKVANADNTIVDVTCGAVKVTEGPEYTLRDHETTVFPITVGSYLMVYACKTDQYYQTPVEIRSIDEALVVRVNEFLYEIRQYGEMEVFLSQTPNEVFSVEVLSGSGEILCR